MKTVPEKPDLTKLAESTGAPKVDKPASPVAKTTSAPDSGNKKQGHYGPIILFNILLLPVLVVVIDALVNAAGSDIAMLITIIWWIAFVGGNIILFGQRKTRIILTKLMEDDRAE